jgi:hypothetical protein
MGERLVATQAVEDMGQVKIALTHGSPETPESWAPRA